MYLNFNDFWIASLSLAMTHCSWVSRHCEERSNPACFYLDCFVPRNDGAMLIINHYHSNGDGIFMGVEMFGCCHDFDGGA